jgi:hypothetical protein
VAKKTRKKSEKKKRTTGSKLIIRGRKTPPVRAVPEGGNIFWPDRIDHVKAIAMRGLDDSEMAVMMGVSDGLMESWRKYYPEFNKAIEEGRALPDQEVIAALHRNAVGYEREQDVVVRGRKGAMVLTTKVYYPGETAAQRYWLNNRQPKNWKERHDHAIGGKGPDQPVHLKAETKVDVINSILNMITPQPDGR